MPDGVLESPSLEDYRIHLLAEARVEAVISLHPYVFRPYTTEKTYAIVLQKLPQLEKGHKSADPIWMYILENDGFQKGDKRYPINENDIPDLLLNYLTTNAKAPHKFVNPLNVNASNFHNLLPEFYLDYYEEDYRQVDAQAYRTLISGVTNLNARIALRRGQSL
mgnify:CR=1 FL=1